VQRAENAQQSRDRKPLRHFVPPPLARGGFGRGRALQLRGVADYKSSAQRVGALCIAGLTLRMASHVLPCSRKLMRSATDLPEDSKGTRTFLWPWVQTLLHRRPPPAAEAGSRSRGSGQNFRAPSEARQKFWEPQPVNCWWFFVLFGSKKDYPRRGYRAAACGIYGVIVAHYHLESPAGEGVSDGTPPALRATSPTGEALSALPGRT
jgi:hypothetical protein